MKALKDRRTGRMVVKALMLVMACGFAAPEVQASPEAAARVLAEDLKTGSLLFSDGKCLAVKLFSGSRYTHVATVVRLPQGIFVFDSQNGVGVRKLPLAKYLAETKGSEIEVLEPARSFSAARAKRFRAYLESQLGRPYDILHYLTGSRSEGVHCAEYLTDALIAVHVVTAEQPSRVSPASLRTSLLSHDLYDMSSTLLVLTPEPERANGRNWCHELWLDTQNGCETCWNGFRGCVLCQ